MPPFSVLDEQGNEFHYDPEAKAATLLIFYSPQKSQSIKAIQDLQQVLNSFKTFPRPLTVMTVSDDPNSALPLKVNNLQKLTVHSVRDTDFKLWGEFGAIASPTVFLAGPDGKIELVKAGHGYDFAPEIKLQLRIIMGLVRKDQVDESGHVKTVTNQSTIEKANRHLKMAELLENKGSYESAAEQLKAAFQIDPNNIEIALQLGRLYCALSDPKMAINAVEKLQPERQVDQALRAFVLGVAYGRSKNFKPAEKYLQETVRLDPDNSRAYYELGKIYQDQNLRDKAIISYRKSLDLVFHDQ